MRVICISGKARHGKDTAADFIKPELEKRGYRVLKTSYGDLVKYVCKTFFGWNGEKDERGRTLLQYVGTDIIRNQKPDYWVDFVADMMSFFEDKWDYVLIPDCRFPNEIERMKERDFDVYSLRVIRDDFKSDLTEEQLKHPSETALDDYSFDFVVHNDKGLEEFREKLLAEVVDEVAFECAEVVLVELDYKGYYERYALTLEEFKRDYIGERPDIPEPSRTGDSYTLRPLVHMWYQKARVGSNDWTTFFTNMEYGLPESDIESGNLAYIDYDRMEALRERVREEFGE